MSVQVNAKSTLSGILTKARRTDLSPGALRRLRLAQLLNERGGLPPRVGDWPRSSEDRVLEIRAQLERLAELIQWDRDSADAVAAGRQPLHKATMIMFEARGFYSGEFGALRYQVDVWVQQRIDPTEDVSR